jgi:hypothetical protein
MNTQAFDRLFDARIERVLEPCPDAHVACRRTTAALNHMPCCPVAPIPRLALEHNGFWVNGRETVSVFDTKKLPPALPLYLQFIDSDAAFI